MLRGVTATIVLSKRWLCTATRIGVVVAGPPSTHNMNTAEVGASEKNNTLLYVLRDTHTFCGMFCGIGKLQ